MATGKIEKLQKRLTVQVVTIPEQDIGANATVWATYSTPSGYTALGVVGYWLSGSVGYLCNLYAINSPDQGSSVAIRNQSSTAGKVAIRLNLLCETN